jgi:capsular polysaccharide biosynthesis protein/dethiobiotin synthetase
LKRGWLVFERRWPLIIAPIVIALLAVTLYDSLMPQKYTATAALFLRAPDVKTSASAYQGNLFTMQRANTYVEMIKSDELAQLVVDRLGLGVSAHELATQVSAAPVRDTVIIDISVMDPDRQQAANLSNTYGTEFATYVAKVEAANLTPDMPPLVTIVRPASADDATSSLLTRRFAFWMTLMMVGLLGLAIGVLLTWLAERYDTKLRSRRQIEDVTHTRVLGNLTPEQSLKGGESVDEVFERSPKFADEARLLGINAEHALREVAKANGAAVLAVASVDEGDGKSVVARSIAKALHERGVRVGLLHLLPDSTSSRAEDTRTDAIATGAGKNGFPLRSVRTNGAPSEQQIITAIESLSTDSDFIIVDPNGSGLSSQMQIAASLSDAAIIVVRPGHTDENALVDLVNAITMLETPVIGVVANRAKETSTSGRVYA